MFGPFWIAHYRIVEMSYFLIPFHEIWINADSSFIRG